MEAFSHEFQVGTCIEEGGKGHVASDSGEAIQVSYFHGKIGVATLGSADTIRGSPMKFGEQMNVQCTAVRSML